MTLELSWSIAREGNELRIAYTVHNQGSASVVVTDSLVFERAVRPELVIVQDASEANTVAFRRGYVESNMKSYLPLPTPTVVELASGAQLARTARVPLPLKAFHDVDQQVLPLRPGATHAVLEVGWIDHPEARLQRQAIAEKTFVETATHWIAQKWLRGERLPLP